MHLCCPSRHFDYEHLGQYLGFMWQSQNVEINVNMRFLFLAVQTRLVLSVSICPQSKNESLVYSAQVQ